MTRNGFCIPISFYSVEPGDVVDITNILILVKKYGGKVQIKMENDETHVNAVFYSEAEAKKFADIINENQDMTLVIWKNEYFC